jgi:hypothetical protein
VNAVTGPHGPQLADLSDDEWQTREMEAMDSESQRLVRRRRRLARLRRRSHPEIPWEEPAPGDCFVCDIPVDVSMVRRKLSGWNADDD